MPELPPLEPSETADTGRVAALFPVDPTGEVSTGRAVAPFPVDPAGEVSTGLAAAPFPVEPAPDATGKNAAPFPVEPVSAHDTARTAAPFPVERPSAPDKGRVAAAHRAAKSEAKPDADTGKVGVPFRVVEAPFPVAQPAPDTTGQVAVPMAVAKLRTGTTGQFEEDAAVKAVALAAPFPIEDGVKPLAPAPRAGLAPRERIVLMVSAVLIVVLGFVTMYLVSGDSTPKPSLVVVKNPSEPVKPGFLRINALCGGMQIPARVSIHGIEKGETPLELPLPTSFPPGKHSIELHLAGRLGEPVDAVYDYHLPLDTSQPGVAADVELKGCGSP